MSGEEDVDEVRRHAHPYGAHHPIPTIEKYQRVKQERAAAAEGHGSHNHEDNAAGSVSSHSTWKQYSDWWSGRDNRGANTASESRPNNGPVGTDQEKSAGEGSKIHEKSQPDEHGQQTEDSVPTLQDTSEVPDAHGAKKSRQRKDSGAERQVTDPVTHLPVTIRDFTQASLEELAVNDQPYGTTQRTATGRSNQLKSPSELRQERDEIARGHEAMQSLFPPPDYDHVRRELAEVNKLGLTVSLVGIAVLVPSLLATGIVLRSITHSWWNSWLADPIGGAILLAIGAVAVFFLVSGLRTWMTNRFEAVWDDAIWDSSGDLQKQRANKHEIETVAWLNSVLAAVWPLMNPDLLIGLADTLEDVMQASLPSLIRMVSVDDIGQGTESLRILGIKWLPTGASARSVANDGHLKKEDEKAHPNDRSGDGDMETSGNGGQTTNQSDKNGSEKPKNEKHNPDGAEIEIAEGMEGEEGDFINLEVAFAYRARSSKSFSDRIKDMHLYLAFYLPANIKIPIWVDLRGMIGTMRMRLQLTPDPPFFALCTMTFLGQPRVDIGCTPLIKRGPNIMDLPLIKNFVQSSVDAAMSEYVSPKSLTLDLKDMLAGDDFKKDTAARGILVVHIERGYDFRTGDPGIPLIKKGGADPYVSVGWAKFGRPLWSTRVLLNEMEPCWRETAYILVTPEALHAEERLRVQLWDSDRLTADDDLGRIELDLKSLMKGESNGKMQHRKDGFRALKAGEEMPGKLEWSVGYFSKVRLQQCQLNKQTFDPEVRSMEQLEEKVNRVCEHKLREAYVKDGHSKTEPHNKELEQQKTQERKSMQDAMIISAAPPDDYPSGIFSIQIHQATGLGLKSLQKSRKQNQSTPEVDENDEDDSAEAIPSSYCVVILNHRKIYKTRTKPHNPRPFYNASTERFIADWRDAEVIVSMRDARVHEEDALLGIVHLPLAQIFKDRSQIDGFYPLLGGIGFGRVRLSMVWRSVQLQAPSRDLGWQYGTIELANEISMQGVDKELTSTKLKIASEIGDVKLHPDANDAVWRTRRKRRSARVPVAGRYGSCLSIQFRSKALLKQTKTAAFAVLWLNTIPDEEEQYVTLPIYKETNGGNDFKRAIHNCVEGSAETLGEIKLKLTFWSGLGEAHSHWASKDPNLRNVVEVLETAHDNHESHEAAKAAGIVDDDASDDSESSDDDSSDDEFDADEQQQHSIDASHDRPVTSVSESQRDGGRSRSGSKTENQDDGKQSIFGRARDYKKHLNRTHRQHRGLMQWKLPRTAQWAIHKAGRLRSTSLLKHHDREPDIETEV